MCAKAQGQGGQAEGEAEQGLRGWEEGEPWGSSGPPWTRVWRPHWLQGAGLAVAMGSVFTGDSRSGTESLDTARHGRECSRRLRMAPGFPPVLPGGCEVLWVFLGHLGGCAQGRVGSVDKAPCS